MIITLVSHTESTITSNRYSEEAFNFQQGLDINNFEDEDNVQKSIISNMTVNPIHYFDEDGYSHAENKTQLYLPIWQTSVRILINSPCPRWCSTPPDSFS